MAELKYTKHLLGKIEELFKELDYTVRYAKGRFQSGYCLVEQQKIAVVNKFFETEGRINVLIEILDNMEIEEEALSDKSRKTYQHIKKSTEEETPESEEVATIKEEVVVNNRVELTEEAKILLKKKVQERIRAKIKVKKRKTEE